MSILHNIDLDVDIGIHRRKRKSAIVWLVCVRNLYRAGALFYFISTLLDFIFSCIRGTKSFFCFRTRKFLSVAPNIVCPCLWPELTCMWDHTTVEEWGILVC
jgi:hypothetical protein